MTKKQMVKRLNAMIDQLTERVEIAETHKGYFQYCASKYEQDSKEQAQLLVEVDKIDKNVELDRKTIDMINEYKSTLEA